MDKPWEGRCVYCSGADNTAKSDKGWIETRETGAGRVEIVLRKPNDTPHAIEMTRDQAKTFAAHLMNLAGRVR